MTTSPHVENEDNDTFPVYLTGLSKESNVINDYFENLKS